MPISIQGSQVKFDGGTFNDVAGNMNQRFTTIISQQRTDSALISTGDPDDYQAAPASTELSRPRTVRTRVHGGAPYSRSQRPREYHSQTGIEPIGNERIVPQHFDAPASSSLTRPHGLAVIILQQLLHHMASIHPPSHPPTGSVSRIAASPLYVVPAAPRMNPEGLAAGISYATFNSVHRNMIQTSVTSYGETGAF
ncbi:hypothetical protein B0H13DRAFT_1914592 [Mycena leptocephala]|nr:hypothetical protein B0H13DRAFT_1914592 [Mycena leptocephala]